MRGLAKLEKHRYASWAFLIIAWTALIAAIVFFLSVRGAEETLVPNVEGIPLTDALLQLQVKELYPRIQLRYSADALDEGNVLEQDPRAGTIVKAGRRIRLVVSQGVVVSAVENYVGRPLEDVRLDLQALSAKQGGAQSVQLVSIREPAMYIDSEEPAGTILEQKPIPGTKISGPTLLDLVVSRGHETPRVPVPTLFGMTASEASTALNLLDLGFAFTSRKAAGGEKPETVVAQIPPAGESVDAGTRVVMEWTLPASVKESEKTGILSYTFPQNPYPVPVTLKARYTNGTEETLVSTRMAGGEFSYPYRVPKGTVLIVYMMDNEIYREVVE